MNTWDMRKTIGAIAVAVAVAGVGGAAIAAATGGGHFMMESRMGGPGGPPPMGAPKHADDESASLHGEYVVANGSSGFRTVVSQTGRVTAISPTTVTARSTDGFTQTYVIRGTDSATKPLLVVDELVSITATREGQTAVVNTIQPPFAPGH